MSRYDEQVVRLFEEVAAGADGSAPISRGRKVMDRVEGLLNDAERQWQRYVETGDENALDSALAATQQLSNHPAMATVSGSLWLTSFTKRGSRACMLST